MRVHHLNCGSLRESGPADGPDSPLPPARVVCHCLLVRADTVCVFARLGEHLVRMRDFCAPIGVLEEPASGTTSAALADYLNRHPPGSKTATVTVEQGAELGRPSQIEVHVETQQDQPVATVWGSALRTAIGMVFPT
jgi:PhzF family phenazine biosynthesis protein